MSNTYRLTDGTCGKAGTNDWCTPSGALGNRVLPELMINFERDANIDGVIVAAAKAFMHQMQYKFRAAIVQCTD